MKEYFFLPDDNSIYVDVRRMDMMQLELYLNKNKLNSKILDIYPNDDRSNYEVTDLINCSVSYPLISENACNKLAHIIDKCGKLLETNCSIGKYYFLFINEIDAIDYDQSVYEVAQMGSKTIYHNFEKLYIKKRELANLEMYKIKNQSYLPLVTEEFVKAVEDNCLTGFKFCDPEQGELKTIFI